MVEGKIDYKSIINKIYTKLDSLGGYVNPENIAPLKGAAAHEVAVGPVHAGVIEPGHFRIHRCKRIRLEGENYGNPQNPYA